MTLKELSGIVRGGQVVALMNAEGEMMRTNRPEGKDFTGFMLEFTDMAEEEVKELNVLGLALTVRLDTTRKTANVLANLVKRENAPLWFYDEVNGRTAATHVRSSRSCARRQKLTSFDKK